MTSDTSTINIRHRCTVEIQVFRTHKGRISADFKLYIDGVLKVTKTTNLDYTKMQPFYGVLNSAVVEQMR
jgi:hypothetical protein